MTAATIPPGARRRSLLTIRGTLRMRLRFPRLVPRAKLEAARDRLGDHFPGETIPEATEAAVAWLVDRLEAEGPTLLHRYTTRKEPAADA